MIVTRSLEVATLEEVLKISKLVWQVTGVAVCALMATSAHANLVIVPTFASNITSDAHAAPIEGVINSAISVYEADFSDPVTVDITFQEGGGLGASSFNVYTFAYSTFYTAIQADATTADDATAMARLALDGTGANNPINGTSSVMMKAATAHALGLSCFSQGCADNEGGTITLNTAITNPGSSGSSGTYNLLPVVEHEIDEILGLGSTLGLGVGDNPSPEDFFRFTAGGARSFTTTGTTLAYFALNGTTDLAQFDNQNDGGDFGDWQSNPKPSGVAAQVQDAFATPGALPSLGVELQALDVIGYNRINIAPEPGTLVLAGAGMVLVALARRRRAR